MVFWSDLKTEVIYLSWMIEWSYSKLFALENSTTGSVRTFHYGSVWFDFRRLVSHPLISANFASWLFCECSSLPPPLEFPTKYQTYKTALIAFLSITTFISNKNQRMKVFTVLPIAAIAVDYACEYIRNPYIFIFVNI